jgi:hypothetical protein
VARLRNDDVNVSTLLIEKREMTHDMQQQTYSTPKNLRTYDRDRQDIQLLEAHFGKMLCGCVVITNRLPKHTSFLRFSVPTFKFNLTSPQSTFTT